MDFKDASQHIKAVVGLGNPGQKYYHHRHSIGFRILDECARAMNAAWKTTDTMEYCSYRLHDNEIYLIKPQAYMNNSGVVIPWLQKKGIRSDQILVVHDELEKPFGDLMVKFGGSHKGHNGLKSIMNAIGADFWRLRFGIGRPINRSEVPDYVLSNFTSAEEVMIAELISKAVGIVLL